MQDKFPLFSADVGSRIAWLRERQGLTLDRLADGRASTAQSWEKGKMPRREKWSGISERLGLSESLIFLGRPESQEDYAFIAKWHAEIQDADERLAFHKVTVAAGKARQMIDARAVTREGPQPMVASRLSPAPGAPSTRADCEIYIAELLAAAERSGNPNAFPVIHDRLKKQFPLSEWEEAP